MKIAKNLFVKRLSDGSVEILQFASDTIWDTTITADPDGAPDRDPLRLRIPEALVLKVAEAMLPAKAEPKASAEPKAPAKSVGNKLESGPPAGK